MAQNTPIKYNEMMHLQKLGVAASNIGFTTVTFQSDKYVCIREKMNEKSQVAIIETANPSQMMRRPITADSAIMNPKSKLVALKAGKTLQVFDLESKKKVAAHNVTDDVNYWKWATSEIIGFASGGNFYHWKISLQGDNMTEPQRLFQLHPTVTSTQLINYHLDNTQTWCVLIGVSAVNGKIGGSMQLFSVERNVTQPIPGHAASFAQLQIEDNPHLSQLFIFGVKDDNGAKVQIIEMGAPAAGNKPFGKRGGDIFFQPDAVADFPVAIHTDGQSGMFYLLTKSGYMYMYDIETATCFYATKISQEVIFASVNASSGPGFWAINRAGSVFSVQIEPQQTLAYFKSRNMEALAMKMSQRCGFPGSEGLFIQKFNALFSQGQFESAARFAARTPNNILRTTEVIRRFQSVGVPPGGTSPLLHYFSCLLEMGKLNREESVELCRPVIAQNKKQLVEKWLKEDKLECSEELGDVFRTVDINLALSTYLKSGASEKVMQCLAETGQFDKIAVYAQKVGANVDYSSMLMGAARSNPDNAVELGKQLVAAVPPLMTVDTVTDVFMSLNLVKQCANFLLEALKNDSPEDAVLQTRFFEMTLSQAPQVAEAVFARKMFSHYDRSHIAGLCERSGLYQRALEHYTDIYNIKRVIVNTHALNPEWLVEYFSNLSVEDCVSCLKLLLETNLRQNLPLCVQVATKYNDLVSPQTLISLFEGVRSIEGVFLYLSNVVNYSQDADVHFKYIQAACKIGQFKEAERICRESNVYEPEKVKNFLKEARLQDHLPLVIVCDRFNYVQDLVMYLYKQEATHYIEIYVQKINPTRLPEVVGYLLDADGGEDFVKALIIQAGENYDMTELVNQVSKRSRLRLLNPLLEQKLATGSTDAGIHSAMAMVYVDGNVNPEKFLRENKYYDGEVVGNFCETYNPNLAFIAYEKDCCDDLIEKLCYKHKLYRQLARYLVVRMEADMWKRALDSSNEHRRALIDQIVQTALPECQDPEAVSFTVKAFMQADLPNELVEMLDKLIINNTIFTQHRNLQNLLILTTIKADKSRVMDYILRIDNYDASDIANICIQNGLFEEAFTIHKKFEAHTMAIEVLLNYIKDQARAYEYAERCNLPALWSILGLHELNQGMIKESISSYIKANDVSNHRQVILAVKKTKEYDYMKKFIVFVRNIVTDSFIDTEYAFCLVCLGELEVLDRFVKETAHLDLVALGDTCIEENQLEAAVLFYQSASNYPKLAVAHMLMKNYEHAIDCAKKANKLQTWRQLCTAAMDQNQLDVAHTCALSLAVNPDELIDIVRLYEQKGLFDRLIAMLQAALTIERTHMGIFTELAVVYSKYAYQKVQEYIEMYITRINIPKVLNAVENAELWSETEFLYAKYEEYDNALRIMLEHPVEAYRENSFKDVVTKVSNVELLYKAITFLLEQHPLILSDFLVMVALKMDPTRVISIVKAQNHIALIKGYLEFSQKTDSKVINETLNSLYMEEGLIEQLSRSVSKYTNFDMVKTAQLLENHELIEFRRIANRIYKQCNRWNKSIELAKKDGLDKDAVLFAGESRDPVYVKQLFHDFTSRKMKDAVVLLLYHCYDLLSPDDVLEACWKNDLTDFCMPYFIQLLSDVIPTLKDLGGKVAKQEQQNSIQQPAFIVRPQPLMIGAGAGPQMVHYGNGMPSMQQRPPFSQNRPF